ncbi:MAG: hypothetical protein H7061_08365, partial [Bdellovibrionaceae bacterium]|nr:hypothetical protein [Bdellovibrio sp.]
ANIKARIIDRITAYRLKDAPNKATIRVSIGGRTISESPLDGWTLELDNSVYFIKFHGAAIPQADEAISVDYTPAGAA